MTWNVEGLESVLKNMPENILNSDVLVLTETFIREATSIPGYYGYHVLANQGDAGRPSGGISCLIKPWLSPLYVLHRSRNVLAIKTNSMYVMCVYFQPHYSEQFIIDSLSETIGQIKENMPVILAGDLNCRTDKINQKATMVIEYLTTEGLRLINNPTDPTYVSPNGTSTIDLIFVNSGMEERIIANSSTTPIRKHLPVKALLRLQKPVERQENRNPQKPCRSLNQEALQHATRNTNIVHELILDGKIDEASKTLAGIIQDTHIFPEGRKRKMSIWFDRECYREKSKVLYLLHTARTSNQPDHLEAYACARRKKGQSR